MLWGRRRAALDTGSTARSARWSCAIAMGFLAFMALEGYVFGRGSLYNVPAFSTLALHTALSFVALSVAAFIGYAPRSA